MKNRLNETTFGQNYGKNGGYFFAYRDKIEGEHFVSSTLILYALLLILKKLASLPNFSALTLYVLLSI